MKGDSAMAIEKQEDKSKISMRFSVFELERIIVALLCNVTNKNFYKNVRDLFARFNELTYRNDIDKDTRVFLIQRITDTVIANNVPNKETLLSTIDVSGKYQDKATELLNSLFNASISDAEMKETDRKISLQLKFSVIDDGLSDKLISSINSIKSESYDDLGKTIGQIEDSIANLDRNFKNYREAIEEANNTVSLSSDEFLGSLNKYIEEEKNPNTRVRTGIKLFNQILDGGWQNENVYCALGVAKGWKSGFLLSSAIWAKTFNDLKPKDPTKKPIILYLTLENSLRLTTGRLISYCRGNSYDVKKCTLNEVATTLQQSEIFTPNDASKPEIVMMYKSNKSVSVDDIKSIIDDFYKNGKEVVFLVIDYMKRIKPVEKAKDLRFDLSSIADDLHTLAVEKHIPILTAMQMNRMAISELDQATSFEQKIQALNRIGGSNVGESIDIIQNVDFAFTVARTVDAKLNEQGVVESVDKFLTVKVVANRNKNVVDVDSFTQRFLEGNDMRLVEDADADVSTSIVNTSTLLTDKIKENGIKTKGPRQIG
jgi:replicative DNA helicase